MSTFVNIGTLLKNNNTLIKFYALIKEDAFPFELVIPEVPNTFTHNYNWPLGNSNSMLPTSVKLFYDDNSRNTLNQLNTETLKVFILFYSQKNKLPFSLEEVLQAKCDNIWDLIDSNRNIYNRELFPIEETNFINQLFGFFESDNYSEFKNLMTDFECFVKSKCWPFGVLKNYYELLLCELILKDVSRPFFLIEKEINEKVNFVEKDGSLTNRLVNQDNRYFNKTQLINLILCQNENKSYPFSTALSYSTHVKIEENSLNGFSSTISIFWTASKSKQIQSNIENEINLSNCVLINLKDILRYSENYIDYEMCKQNKINIGSNQEKLPILNLTELINNLAIVVPESLTESEPVTHENQKFTINENFKRLTNSIKISNSYFNYCRYLFSVIKNGPDNLYIEDCFIRIPYWEISRIQHLNLEKFLRIQSENDLLEEQRDDNHWQP